MSNDIKIRAYFPSSWPTELLDLCEQYFQNDWLLDVDYDPVCSRAYETKYRIEAEIVLKYDAEVLVKVKEIMDQFAPKRHL